MLFFSKQVIYFKRMKLYNWFSNQLCYEWAGIFDSKNLKKVHTCIVLASLCDDIKNWFCYENVKWSFWCTKRAKNSAKYFYDRKMYQTAIDFYLCSVKWFFWRICQCVTDITFNLPAFMLFGPYVISNLWLTKKCTNKQNIDKCNMHHTIEWIEFRFVSLSFCI